MADIREAGAGSVWIDTDHAGQIVNCHPDAAALIGYTSLRARGRQLPFMFIAGRPDPAHLTQVALGHVIDIEAVIRPKDRRGVPVRCRIEPAPTDSLFLPVLRWTITPRTPVLRETQSTDLEHPDHPR